jgi:hypothetical protein
MRLRMAYSANVVFLSSGMSYSNHVVVNIYFLAKLSFDQADKGQNPFEVGFTSEFLINASGYEFKATINKYGAALTSWAALISK